MRKIKPYVSVGGVAAAPAQPEDDTIDLTSDPGQLPLREYPTPVVSTPEKESSFVMEAIIHGHWAEDHVEYWVKFVDYNEPEWIQEGKIDGVDMIAEFACRFPTLAAELKEKKKAHKHKGRAGRAAAAQSTEPGKISRQTRSKTPKLAEAQSMLLSEVWMNA
ncbi:hypothetical protein HDU93_000542 [Gonapodya sp. JEL0774]|nr:hypothetical protein HDU93_000542 [Gonapodya sp. JEL0774]